MNTETPITFTIKQVWNSNGYRIETKDIRAGGIGAINYPANQVFEKMAEITETLNNRGFAVLFEVE